MRLSHFAVAFIFTGAAGAGIAQNIDASSILMSRKKIAPAPSKGNSTLSLPGAIDVPLSDSIADVSTDEAEATVGRGYNTFKNYITDYQCVEPRTGKYQNFAPKGNAIVRSDFVSDEKSRSSVSGGGFSIGASFKSIGIGFSQSSSDGTSFNSIDEYYRVYRRMELNGKEIIDVKWTPQAEAYLKNNDIKGFVKTCGTKYVRIVRGGQILDSMIQTSISQTASGSADANAVGINFASIISLGVSDSTAETNLSKQANIIINHYGKGTLFTPPFPYPSVAPGPAVGASGAASSAGTGTGAGTGVAVPNSRLISLLQYASTDGYDANVLKAGRASAVPLWIRVQRYSDQNLPLAEKIPQWPDQIAFIMQKKYPTFQDLLTVKTDLDWALTSVVGGRLKFYTLEEITDANGNKISAETQAKERLAKAVQLMADFQSDVAQCSAAIDNELQKQSDGQPAVNLCAVLIETHLKQDAVNALKLSRKLS
jgi:hypothetical protein